MINQLIQQAQPYWKQYVEHEFVQQLAKGTLPKACFQHYLKQDYIYLFHYSRAFALGVFKARNFAEMAIIEHYKGLRRRPIWEFELSTAISELNRLFGTKDLRAFGVEKSPLGLAAAGCLLQYAKETQRASLPHIQSISVIQNNDNIQLDAATRRNLELTQNLAGGTENTLASVLDKCVTPMGSRLLKRWIHQPIRQTDILLKRQKTIGEIIEQDLYHELQPYLQQVGDMERILARVALRSARPRDLTRLRTALEQIEPIKSLIHTKISSNLTALSFFTSPPHQTVLGCSTALF